MPVTKGIIVHTVYDAIVYAIVYLCLCVCLKLQFQEMGIVVGMISLIEGVAVIMLPIITN